MEAVIRCEQNRSQGIVTYTESQTETTSTSQHDRAFPRSVEARSRLVEFQLALDLLYDKWEKAPSGILRGSPERITGPSRFWIHAAADAVEFSFANVADECYSNGYARASDAFPAWSAYKASGALDRLAGTVAAFLSLSDDELLELRPRRGWTVGEFRKLLFILHYEVSKAIADRSSKRLACAIFDLQLALDPAHIR